MTWMQKLENLSALQKVHLAAANDMDSLTAFAVTNGVELTDEEKQQVLQHLGGTMLCDL